MTIHYQGHGVALHHGDCLDVLRALPDASVDSVVTDPPYSLTSRREQYCASDVLRHAIVEDAQHSDTERAQSLVALRITVSPGLAVQVWGVDLDSDVAARQEEVDDDGTAGRQVDDVLVHEGDAMTGEERSGGKFRLWVRQGGARCVGACRCLGKDGEGRIRVPVRLRHHAPSEAKGTARVVAGGGAELAAVLALDVAGGSGELLPASGADSLDPPFELLCPVGVGAGPRARRLSAVSEPGGVGAVGDPADGALSFDLLAHRIVLSWRPTILRGFMSSLWDGTGIETDVRLWRECLRVLKPGGHLLAFGAPRTWHNTQTAIEQAGFEIRDAVAWMSGSGFPKSLDVSKAIDKRANVNDETHRRIALVAEVIRTHREAKGMERSAVSLAVVGTPSGACWNWEHQQLPSAEMWPAIKRVLDIPDKFDGLIEGTRAQFIGAEREVIGAEREVIGERTTGLGTGRGAVAYIGDSDNRDVTAPATDAAREWEGWGTALKPAFEPVVVARKPLAGTVAGNVLAWGTGALNVDGCRIAVDPDDPVNTAVWTSRPSTIRPGTQGFITSHADGERSAPRPPGLGRWPANVVLDESQAEALDEQSGTLTSGLMRAGTKPKGERETYGQDAAAGYETTRDTPGDSGGASRFFFIAREDNPCHSTSSASTVESPSSHPRGPADSAPSDAATTACPDGERLTGSPSTSETPSASRPSVESGTTPTMSTAGASSPDWQPGEPSQMVSRARYAASLSRTATTTTTTSPSSSAGSVDPTTSSTTQASAPGVPLDELGSRFNYVAKADASERPRVNGTAHPTVKPLALMRWLVRLVTPPGGTVLEPFAGSGTTVEACIVEGFDCIAIEREADYLPLIRQRIDRRRDPVEALRGQAADLGLFDLLGGELA